MINQNWVFGVNAGLDFSTAVPTPTTGNAISTNEGCASISDDNGNLLFYTDGLSVWDASKTLLANNLLGDSSSTQSSIIVPDPGDPDQYYIFTVGSLATPPPAPLSGAIVNVPAATVTPLPGGLFPSSVGFSTTERVLAIQHANCEDYWIITIVQDGNTAGPFYGNGVFRVFSLTAAGLNFIGATPMNRVVTDLGYLKGSHDGNRIALADSLLGNVLVYPFDNTTGAVNVSAEVVIQAPLWPDGALQRVYGVEFSPSSQVLYYGNLSGAAPNNGGNIYQVDLTAAIPASTLIGTTANTAGNYAIGALQMGINDVIYIARESEGLLGAILNPDVLGAGCNFDPANITLLPGSEVRLGLPNLLALSCDGGDEDCPCHTCTENADELNEELIDRAQDKFNVQASRPDCPPPFGPDCETSAIGTGLNLEPCFYFHWGDGVNDQIEEHDTEVFYLTVCNNFNDITYRGLQISKVTLIPDIHPIDKIHIVPDRLICFDCLEPCSCQTREFALITRANDTAGNYRLEVEYCFQSIGVSNTAQSGTVSFDIEITED